MPTTVHTTLLHGPKIIKEMALLSIGMISEEAQEARNKDIKKYLVGFFRKCSRSKSMENILNLLLISSDPLISSMRQLPRKKDTKFSKKRWICCCQHRMKLFNVKLARIMTPPIMTRTTILRLQINIIIYICY
jgi:hypothetical protein